MNKTPNGQPGDNANKKPFLPRGWLYIILTGIGLAAVLWRLSGVFTVVTAKYEFLVQGGANILIFLAILAQVLIYKRQWDVMNDTVNLSLQATRPILIIDARMATYGPDPVGRVEVNFRNEGNTPATVNVSFEITYRKQLNRTDKGDIPVFEVIKYEPKPIGDPLTAEQVTLADGENITAKLEIKGSYSFGDVGRYPIDYCGWLVRGLGQSVFSPCRNHAEAYEK